MTTSMRIVSRPLPDFISQLQHKIWEWPGEEATHTHDELTVGKICSPSVAVCTCPGTPSAVSPLHSLPVWGEGERKGREGGRGGREEGEGGRKGKGGGRGGRGRERGAK